MSVQRKPDRRVQRTRQQLRMALLDLMRQHDFDLINIQMITEKANLGRATFYLHYKDKNELLLECMDELVESFIDRIKQLPVEGWALVDGAPILEVFEYAHAHANLYRVIMSSQGGVRVSRRLHELIVSNTQAVLERQLHEKGLAPRLPLEFICNYFAGSLLSLVFWWLENDMPYSSQDMAQMFHQISLYGRAFSLGMEVSN